MGERRQMELGSVQHLLHPAGLKGAGRVNCNWIRALGSLPGALSTARGSTLTRTPAPAGSVCARAAQGNLDKAMGVQTQLLHRLALLNHPDHHHLN